MKQYLVTAAIALAAVAIGMRVKAIRDLIMPPAGQ